MDPQAAPPAPPSYDAPAPPPAAAPRPARQRRWLLGAGLVLVALVAAVLLGEAMGWPFLRQPLQHQLQSRAGVPVQMDGRFRLRLLLHPQLQVQHLRVGAGGGLQLPHLVDAQGLSLAWGWRDLWAWRRSDGEQPLRLQHLQAEALDVRLVRTPDGRSSWQLGRHDAPPPDAGEPRPPQFPRFGSLAVRQGLVLVDDAPLQTQLRISLQGGEGDDAQARAKAGYQAAITGRWKGLALDLALRTGAALDVAQDAAGGAAAGNLPLRVEGRAGAARVLFDGEAGSLLDERRLQGRLQISGPSLAQVGEPLGVTLPRTPPFELRGRLAHADGVWQLRAERMAVGSSLLEGEFRHDTTVRPPRLSGRLGGARLALADLGPSVGSTRGAAAKAPADRAGERARPAGAPRRVLPDTPLDLPSLRVMDADVQVAINELDFGSTAVAPLHQLRTRLLLQGGVLQLQELQAQVAGGRFKGSTRLDGTTQPAQYAADLRFDGVDVAGWLRGLRAPSADHRPPAATQARALARERQQARQGGAQTVQSYLTGTLSGSLRASGAGRSTAEILGSLDGQARLLLRDGTLSHLATEALGLDLAQGLGVLVRGDRPLPLRCARLELQMHDGLVQPRVAVLDSRDSTTRVEGRINLKDETLALRAITRPKDVSPFSLRTPVLVGGTLGAPAVGVDGKRLAGKVLGALALGALVAPAAALLPLVDTGEGAAADPCQ